MAVLYERIADRGGKAKSQKTALCREHGISARMFNAIVIEQRGPLDGTLSVEPSMVIRGSRNAIPLQQILESWLPH
ncbi:hypothetical protein [Paraburkholderia sp. BCC1884]|uniref:hypothetical protein n=1 Tax=Paraburkholderia sp. BCC1884 TaxID=2562668 RepID=UPI001642AEAC|nr:hypothetical protein [Paraburkholderia sp. BCC1884]